MTAPRFPWPMGDKRRGGPLLGPGGPTPILRVVFSAGQPWPDDFSRASVGAFRAADLDFDFAASNTIRSPHYDGAGVSRGVVLEAERINECEASYDLTNAFWTDFGTPVATLDQTGIDGNANKATFLEDDDIASNEQKRSVGFTTAGVGAHVVTWIVDQDADTSRFPELQILTLTATAIQIQLNTSTGAVNIRVGAPDYVDVEDDNGKRWIVKVGLTATNASASLRIAPAITATFGTVEAAALGSIIHGHLQVETGEIGTQPIETLGAVAVRNADDMTTTDDWPANWTVYFRGLIDRLNGERTLFGSTDVSANRIYINASGNLVVQHGATTTATVDAVSAGAEFIAAVSYDGSDYNVILNNGALATDVSGAAYGGVVQVGARSDLSNALNGTLAEMRIYDEALDETTMRALF